MGGDMTNTDAAPEAAAATPGEERSDRDVDVGGAGGDTGHGPQGGTSGPCDAAAEGAPCTADAPTVPQSHTADCGVDDTGDGGEGSARASGNGTLSLCVDVKARAPEASKASPQSLLSASLSPADATAPDTPVGALALDEATRRSRMSILLEAGRTDSEQLAPPVVETPTAGGGAHEEKGAAEEEEGEEEVSVEQRVEVAVPASTRPRVSVDDLDFLSVIGEGAMGKVFLVRRRADGHVFALKSIRKKRVVKKKKVAHMHTERYVLAELDHPFLMHLEACFTTPGKIFFMMEYCVGGNLYTHLLSRRRFKEARARFYTAELVLAIGHLHSRNVAYRDLKLENVVLDADGHIRLVDFGLCKQLRGAAPAEAHLPEVATSFVGTVPYLAPEVVGRRGHGVASDWWSVGVLVYEMVCGCLPWYSAREDQLCEMILSSEVSFPRKVRLSAGVRNLIKWLLNRDVTARLGCGGRDVEEVKAHSWFQSIDWDALERREVKPPYVPPVARDDDVTLFDEECTQKNAADSPVETSMRFDDEIFAGLSYTRSPVGGAMPTTPPPPAACASPDTYGRPGSGVHASAAAVPAAPLGAAAPVRPPAFAGLGAVSPPLEPTHGSPTSPDPMFMLSL